MDKKVFFIADTHFGHEKVIGYERRPFKDAEEMDRALIENWNNTVEQDDEVFMLGDFSFHTKEKTSDICKSLNGRKILVMGNHDRNSVKFYMDCGFVCASKYPLIIEKYWILSHEPLYINANMPYANIFGHVHGNGMYKDYSAQSYCVSAERINYTPVDFEVIKEAVLTK